MARLEIQSESSSLSIGLIARLNERLATLARTIDIDFADTGFFANTPFQAVQVVVTLADSETRSIEFHEDQQRGLVLVKSVVPASIFALEKDCYAIDHTREQAVNALAALAERFGVSSKSMRTRAFHIRGDVARSKARAEQQPLVREDYSEIQIHIKLSDVFGAPSEVEFLLGEFYEKMESLIEDTGLGELEGNEIGDWFFTLFCPGEDPDLMLEKVKNYLVSVSNSDEDFVLVLKQKEERKVSISELR